MTCGLQILWNLKVYGNLTVVKKIRILSSNEIKSFSCTNLAFLVWYSTIVISYDRYFLIYSKLKFNKWTKWQGRNEFWINKLTTFSKIEINLKNEIPYRESYTVLRSRSLLSSCHFCGTTQFVEEAKNERLNKHICSNFVFSVGSQVERDFTIHGAIFKHTYPQPGYFGTWPVIHRLKVGSKYFFFGFPI